MDSYPFHLSNLAILKLMPRRPTHLPKPSTLGQRLALGTARPPVWIADCITTAGKIKSDFSHSPHLFENSCSRVSTSSVFKKTQCFHIKYHKIAQSIDFFPSPLYSQSRRLFDCEASYKSNRYFTSQHLTARGCGSWLRGAGRLTYIRRGNDRLRLRQRGWRICGARGVDLGTHRRG